MTEPPTKATSILMTHDNIPFTYSNEEETDMAITVTQTIFMLMRVWDEADSMLFAPSFNDIVTAILEQT